MDVKEFKKIDAHAHIGEFGGWAKLSINAEQLIAQMDEFNIEKTLLCSEPNENLSGCSREITPTALWGWYILTPMTGRRR